MDKDKKKVLITLISIWGILSLLHLGYGLYISATAPYAISGGYFRNVLHGYYLLCTLPLTLLGGILFGWITVFAADHATNRRKCRILFAVLPLVVHIFCCVVVTIPFTVHFFENIAMDEVLGQWLHAVIYLLAFLGVGLSRLARPLTQKIKSDELRFCVNALIGFLSIVVCFAFFLLVGDFLAELF